MADSKRKQRIFEKVRKIVVEQLGVAEEEITLETDFAADLNADSLDLVELIMSLEEEFSEEDLTVEISDEDAENLKTVVDAVNWILENLKD